METSSPVLSKGRGEVRRLHIIYFLSRMGSIDHPHLIRVHHLSPNGVYLRDVKRWLAELRGDDMPETFAWSFKRRYKHGYVWQDLLDDDLITPISDNEFVLKGSEIFATAPFDSRARGEKRSDFILKEKRDEIEADNKEQEQADAMPKSDDAKNQTYLSPRIHNIIAPKPRASHILFYRESHVFGSERSTLTDHSITTEQDKDPIISRQNSQSHEEHEEEEEEMIENRSLSSFYSNFWGKNKKNKKKSNSKIENSICNSSISKEKTVPPSSSFSTSSSSTSTTASPQPSSLFAKSKSYSSSGGTSKVLRNLITCGAVDTNDAAMIMLNKSPSTKPANRPRNSISAEICKGEKLGGSTRVVGTPWKQQQQQRQPQLQHGAWYKKL